MGDGVGDQGADLGGGAGEGGGEVFLGGGQRVGFRVGGGVDFGEGADDLVGGGLELGEVGFEGVLRGESGAGELLRDVVDARFDFAREFGDGVEVVLGRFGDAVETGGGDAELFGGFGGGAGEGGDLVLAFAELGVFVAGVVGEEGHDQEGGADHHANGDGEEFGGAEGRGAASGDDGGGDEEHDVADEKREQGEFRGFFRKIHRGERPSRRVCARRGGYSQDGKAWWARRSVVGRILTFLWRWRGVGFAVFP